MSRRRSGRITIDVWDVIDEVADEDLLDEVRNRKLILFKEGAADDGDLVAEAYRWLLRGNTDEARICLERALFPKWRTAEAASRALQEQRTERGLP